MARTDNVQERVRNLIEEGALTAPNEVRALELLEIVADRKARLAEIDHQMQVARAGAAVVAAELEAAYQDLQAMTPHIPGPSLVLGRSDVPIQPNKR